MAGLCLGLLAFGQDRGTDQATGPPEYDLSWFTVDGGRSILTNYFVKNAAFEEEEEYRICYDANARAADASVAGPTEQYRTAHDGRLVPYVEFDLANRGSKLPITGLVLGPRNANSVDVMKRFLFRHDNLLPSIETSKATYRR